MLLVALLLGPLSEPLHDQVPRHYLAPCDCLNHGGSREFLRGLLRRSGAPGHRQHRNLQVIKALVPHFPAGTSGVLGHLYSGVKMAAMQRLPCFAETLASNSTS